MQNVKVVYDWWQINWFDHVLLNRNLPIPNPDVNITDKTRRWTRLMWEKHSPQIRITIGSAINNTYAIMLKSTIHDHLLNIYCTQFKTVRICHVRNLSSYEFWPMNQLKWLQTMKQQQIWWEMTQLVNK